jgi:hypothetical protein
MSLLPSVISRPMVDAYTDALTKPVLTTTERPGPTGPTEPTGSSTGSSTGQQLLQLDLSAGIPATIGLDGTLSLVLAVPLGVAGVLLAADPLMVVFDTGASDLSDPAAGRELDSAWPRLTLVSGGRIADTAPVTVGVPVRFRDGAGAVVEVVVDRLVLTAGSLRSPGRFGSQIALRWRDLRLAADVGPPASTGDPAVTLLANSRR